MKLIHPQLRQIFDRIIPTTDDAIELLADARWEWDVQCPYCKQTNCNWKKSEPRCSCRDCKKSFGVLKGTRFERWRIDIRGIPKLILVLWHDRSMTESALEDFLGVTRKTVRKLKRRVVEGINNNDSFIIKIYQKTVNIIEAEFQVNIDSLMKNLLREISGIRVRISDMDEEERWSMQERINYHSRGIPETEEFISNLEVLIEKHGMPSRHVQRFISEAERETNDRPHILHPGLFFSLMNVMDMCDKRRPLRRGSTTKPKIHVEPAKLDFGEVSSGQSVAKVFKITNKGNIYLVIDSIRIKENSPDHEFTICRSEDQPGCSFDPYFPPVTEPRQRGFINWDRGKIVPVEVTFTGSGNQIGVRRTGVLEIRHNDPDQGPVLVELEANDVEE